MTRRTAAVALGLHGRTAVALTGAGDDLGVVLRGDVRTRESQPYHEAQALPLEDAERLNEAAAEAPATRATGDLRQIVDQLRADGLEVVRVGIVAKTYRLPSTLAAVLRSHPSCHAAEGRMTVDALLDACQRLGLEVVAHPEAAIDPRTEPVGKLVGPPWRKEHKIAATAALRALDATS
jgi:hypothetical protein